MATKRRREAEVGTESSQATGPDHPEAVKQRDAYARARLARPNQNLYCTALVGLGVSHPPDAHKVAARHAQQQRPGYNSYVRELARDGIALTPAAEICYLAARMSHIHGKTLDSSRESELRSRMVELLKSDDWLCDDGIAFEIADDEVDAMPGTLTLMQCGLIGPELEELAGNGVVRRVLATVSIPGAVENEELDADQSVIAARLADLKLAVQSLLEECTQTPAHVCMGQASDVRADEMYSVLLERMVAGVASGELTAELVAPFASPEALAAHVECFLRSESADFSFLESRLRMVMALHGTPPTPDDVYGAPRERFWSALVSASQLRLMPHVFDGPSPVERLTPRAWMRLMELAVETNARDVMVSLYPGAGAPFADCLKAFAGNGAYEVYAALERHRAIGQRIQEARSDVNPRVSPSRRRSLGV